MRIKSNLCTRYQEEKAVTIYLYTRSYLSALFYNIKRTEIRFDIKYKELAIYDSGVKIQTKFEYILRSNYSYVSLETNDIQKSSNRFTVSHEDKETRVPNRGNITAEYTRLNDETTRQACWPWLEAIAEIASEDSSLNEPAIRGNDNARTRSVLTKIPARR